MTHSRSRLTAAASSLPGLFLALASTSVLAATQTGTLTVTATVLDTCIIDSTTDVDFGTLTPAVGSGPADVAGLISWACSTGTSADLGIADGDRNLLGAGTIPYTLWQDASRTTHWGAIGTADELGGLSGSGMNNVIDTPVYGRIAEADYIDADAGAYTDSLVVTIEF